LVFTNRTSEADIMRAALVATLGRVRRQHEIDTDGLRNVLVFHGKGGVGKSRLSARLESWCRHELTGDSLWGAPPLPEKVGTARWDFTGHQGMVDVPSLLIALRSAVTTPKHKWPAFDLALAAYLAAARPGQPVATTTASDQTDDVLSVLAGIAEDLGAANVATSFGAAAIGRLVSFVRKNLSRSRQLKRFGDLAKILDDCGQISKGDDAPEVAAEIVWLLTQEVEASEPYTRPTVAIFIDHFEKIQKNDSVRSESVINHLVGYLPWVLFVVTGRHRLDWADDRDGLKISGPHQWPLLLSDAQQEPHQHLLGLLSSKDARQLIAERSALGCWSLSNDLLERVVTSTNGWPLHIDAVCQVADNKTARGEELEPETLLGKLPDLVKNLYSGLPVDERRAFNAACLTPFFDISLVAAVGGVDHGAVERCIAKTMVDPNPDCVYPYRVHEEVRRLVRQSSADIEGGWSDQDWTAAAHRALSEAQRRHGEAKTKADDAERDGLPNDDTDLVQAIILGLTVGLNEDVYDDWLGQAMRTTPTVRGLAPRLPMPSPDQASTQAGTLIRTIQALSLSSEESLPILRSIWKVESATQRWSGLWYAYRLRNLHRYDDAAEQFERLIEKYPNVELFRYQRAVTPRAAGRYRQAIAHLLADFSSGTSAFDQFVAICEQGHGIFDHPVRLFNERIERQRSARFRMELRTNYLRRRTFSGEDCRPDAVAWLGRSIDLGYPSYQVACLHTLGMHQLGRPVNFNETLHRIQQLLPQYHGSSYKYAELLALRAFYTRTKRDIGRAIQALALLGDRYVRGHDYIFTEILLEELGAPMPAPEVRQWLIPYSEVKENWLRIAEDLVARVRGEAEWITPDR